MSSSWSAGGQQRTCVRHRHRGTERLMDDRRENWTEENGWQQSKRTRFYFFFWWWGRISCRYVTHLHVLSHVKEHGSMRVRLTQSRTGQEGAGWQAGVFPKLHSPVTLSKLLKKYPWIRNCKSLRRWLSLSSLACFFLLRISFDIKLCCFGRQHSTTPPPPLILIL